MGIYRVMNKERDYSAEHRQKEINRTDGSRR